MTTVVVTVALSWAGWRLLNQQRVIDEQRTADSLAAAIRGKLAETGDRLSAALANRDKPSTIPDAVLLTVRPDGSAIGSTGALPFVSKVQEPSGPKRSSNESPRSSEPPAKRPAVWCAAVSSPYPTDHVPAEKDDRRTEI